MSKHLKIELYHDMGRGVMALKSFKRGEVVELCELLVLSEADTIAVNNTALSNYTFKYNDTQDCLALGFGELYNHSDIPNLSFRLVDKKVGESSRKMLQFEAKKDIEAGEQLFINYNDDVTVNIESYKHNLIK